MREKHLAIGLVFLLAGYISVVSFAVVIILYRIKTGIQNRKQKNAALTKVKI